MTSLITDAEILGPPAGIIDYNDQFADSIGKDDLKSITAFKLIAPSKKIQRTLPLSIDKNIHWKYIKKQIVNQPATYVMEIKDSRVYDDGIVITSEDKMLAGVSKYIDFGEYIPDHWQNPIFTKKTLPPLKKIKGIITVLSAPAGRGYYHWMFDVLPRIQLLRAAGYDLNRIDEFLINNYISKRFSYRNIEYDEVAYPGIK